MFNFKKNLPREILYFILVFILSIALSYYIKNYKEKLDTKIIKSQKELNIKNAHYYNQQYINDPKYKLYKILKKEKIYLSSFEYFNNYYNTFTKAERLFYKLSAQKHWTTDSMEVRGFIGKFFNKDWVLGILKDITHDYNIEKYGEYYGFKNAISEEDYYYRLLESPEDLKECYERTIKLRGMQRRGGIKRFEKLLSFDNPIEFKKQKIFSNTKEYKKIKNEIDTFETKRKKIDVLTTNNYLLSVYLLFLLLFVVRYLIYVIHWCVVKVIRR